VEKNRKSKQRSLQIKMWKRYREEVPGRIIFGPFCESLWEGPMLQRAYADWFVSRV